MLTDSLHRRHYAGLCCFKPVHSDLRCLLPHAKSKSSQFLTFNFKQDEHDVELLCQHIKTHLETAHSLSDNCLAEKEWISDGINYISLKQMVT